MEPMDDSDSILYSFEPTLVLDSPPTMDMREQWESERSTLNQIIMNVGSPDLLTRQLQDRRVELKYRLNWDWTRERLRGR